MERVLGIIKFRKVFNLNCLQCNVYFPGRGTSLRYKSSRFAWIIISLVRRVYHHSVLYRFETVLNCSQNTYTYMCIHMHHWYIVYYSTYARVVQYNGAVLFVRCVFVFLLFYYYCCLYSFVYEFGSRPLHTLSLDIIILYFIIIIIISLCRRQAAYRRHRRRHRRRRHGVGQNTLNTRVQQQ